VGNVGSRLYGAVEVAGSTVTGPLVDVPNLLPTNNPDATGNIRQEGFSVALLKDLADLEKRFNNRINEAVAEAFLSNTKLSAVAANIAVYAQILTPSVYQLLNSGVSVPLPTFQSDGTKATKDQLVAYGAALAGWNMQIFGAGIGFNFQLKLYETVPGTLGSGGSVGSMLYLLDYVASASIPSDQSEISPIFAFSIAVR
jgi:hypothetical protein